MPSEGILLIDLQNSNIVPGENFQSHGPMMYNRPSNYGFSRVPTDPPPPPSSLPPPPTPPRSTPSVPHMNGSAYGAPTNGQPPQYHSVPDVPKRPLAPQYQEIPYETTQNGLTEPAAPARQGSQQSDTEVDQALAYGVPHSNSTVPLTDRPLPPPSEKRPRKKANPLYDGFGEVNTTTSSSSTIKKAPSHKKNTCGRRSFRCIKHPVTICLIILFVIINFIALLLLFTGTVEQVMPGSRENMVQTTPVTPVTDLPDQAEMLQIIRSQGDIIAKLEARVVTLEALLLTNTTENATTTARIAQNSVQIEQLASQVSSLSSNTSTALESLTNSLAVTDLKADSNIQITSMLQSVVEELKKNTTVIADNVNTLTARSETTSQDIVRINSKNTQQDQEITQLQNRISVVQQEFSFELMTFNSSIYTDLAEISKMQGPPGVNGSRGADGVANLRGCKYETRSETSTFSRATEVPPITPTTGYVVTGATCSTYKGTSANLMDNSGIYCKCEGQVATNPGNVRYCYIHYWECPIE